MSLHAGLMTSVAEQGMFPPDYSLLAGRVAVGYPFLCNTVSATLLVLGTGLRAAYITPMALAALSVLLGGFVFLRAFLRKTGPAVLAAVIFFIGGGFGFAYIFDLMKQNPGQLAEMMDAFYRTPMNNVEAGVRWVNVIADMLIPQRATLFGWAILFPCLYLLIRAADGERRLFIPLGILAGGLPLIHTHSFLALGILSAVCVVFALIDARGKLAPIRGYLLFGGIALALAAPQLLLFTFAQASEGEFLRLGFNWANELDNYFWFYIKNMGLLFILMIPAFLHADRRKKRFFLGGALIWLICEFVLFQPNPYDNNKLLFIWFLLLCGIVADWLMDAWGALRAAKIRGVWAVAALTVAVLNLSGVMTLAREVVSEYQLFSRNHVEAASFIREGTAKDALFLTADNHNNAVAALSGRNIVCGSGVFLHYHGLDYVPAWQANHRMLTSPKREELLEYGVNYVYIGDYERGVEGVDLEFFERAFPRRTRAASNRSRPYSNGCLFESVRRQPRPRGRAR